MSFDTQSDVVKNVLKSWNVWNASVALPLDHKTIEVGRFTASLIQHIIDEYGDKCDLLMEFMPCTGDKDVRILASGEWKICDPEDLPFFHIIGRYFPSISSLSDLDEFKEYIQTYLGASVTDTWEWEDRIPDSKLIEYARTKQPNLKQYFFEDHTSVFSRPL